MRELTILIILTLSLIGQIFCSNADYINILIGNYSGAYTNLELKNDFTFKRILRYNECGVSDYKEIVVGEFSVDTVNQIINFFPREFELRKSVKFSETNIPYGKEKCLYEQVKVKLNIIKFGEDIFLVSGDKLKIEISHRNEFLNLVNTINLINGVFKRNTYGNFYTKNRYRGYYEFTRKTKFEYDELVENLGKLYGGYILIEGPMEVKVIKVDESYEIQGYINPITYTNKCIGLYFEEGIQTKLKPGMKLFKDNCVVRIIENELGEKIGISQNCGLNEFKENDILKSNQ